VANFLSQLCFIVYKHFEGYVNEHAVWAHQYSALHNLYSFLLVCQTSTLHTIDFLY